MLADLDATLNALIRLGHVHAPYYPWTYYLAAIRAASKG